MEVQPNRPHTGLRAAHPALCLPLAGLIVLLAYQTFHSTPASIRESQSLDGTVEAITASEALQSALEEAVGDQRGYLLTGRPQYLETFSDSVRGVPADLERLRILSPREPSRPQNISRLVSVVNQDLDAMRHTIEAYDTRGAQAGRQMLQSNLGSDGMTRIEGLIQSIDVGERALVKTRESRIARLERENRYIGLAADVLALAMLFVGIPLTLRAVENAPRPEAEKGEMERGAGERVPGRSTRRIAHELNEALHVIRNSVTTLQRHAHNVCVEAHACLETIRRSIDRASGITRELLAYAPQRSLDPRPADLNDVVAGVEKPLKQVLGEGVSVSVELDHGLSPMYVDRQGLEIALIDLAVSARVVMNGCGKLTLGTAHVQLDKAYAGIHRDAHPGSYALIALSDTGSDPCVEAKTFGPLFRATSMERLSQVASFAKASGGHVIVEGDLKHGTTVKVYLPRQAGAVPGKRLS